MTQTEPDQTDRFSPNIETSTTETPESSLNRQLIFGLFIIAALITFLISYWWTTQRENNTAVTNTPEEALQTFIAAMNRGDYETARAELIEVEPFRTPANAFAREIAASLTINRITIPDETTPLIREIELTRLDTMKIMSRARFELLMLTEDAPDKFTPEKTDIQLEKIYNEILTMKPLPTEKIPGILSFEIVDGAYKIVYNLICSKLFDGNLTDNAARIEIILNGY